jgi:hypothetical protein
MTHRRPATETTPAVSAGSTAETPPEPPADTRAAVPDVSITRGGIGAVQAGEVVVSVGGIGAVQADRVSVELGAIGAVAAGKVRLSSGAASLVLAREARFEQAIVRSVVAQRVTLRRGSAAGIVLAARVDGPGRPLIDGRAGLVAGTIVALAWLIVRRLR